MVLSIVLHSSPFDLRRATEDFEKSWSHVGAVATFAGYVRSHSTSGPVRQLVIDWYPGFTEASLEKIGQDVSERFAVDALQINHRCGVIVSGDPIVFVAAASPHRRAALDAVDCAMDLLKSRAAFWKREEGQDYSQWVEPTTQDMASLSRWEVA